MADVGNLIAKLTLDSTEFSKGAGEIKGMCSDLASGVGSVLSGVAKGVTAAVGAAAAGVASLTKGAIESYAKYEQAVGGVETLFKDSAETVIQNAENAYKTAGISANQYMETVTSISGAIIKSAGRGAQTDLEELKKSLDDQYKETKRHWEDRIALVTGSAQKTSLRRQMEDELEALKEYNKEALKMAEESNEMSVTTAESLATSSELTQTAITDMSDIANKYGKTFEEVSEVYSSLSRGMYQTLDNLFGGMFKGSQAGLEEMLRYAEQYRASLGETVSYSKDNYNDIINAIHDVSEALGVAGTTAEEAKSTISGSLNMVKASWQDLLTALAGGGKDIDQALSDRVESAGYFAENLIPRLEVVLEGIAGLIERIAPLIAELLPGLIESIVPPLLNAAMSIVMALVEALPSLVETIGQALIEIIPALVEAFTAVVEVLLVDVLPLLASLAMQLVLALATSLGEHANEIITGVIVLITTIVTLITENLDLILMAGLQIIVGVVQGLIDNLDLIIDAVVILIFTLVETIIKNLPQILVAAVAIGLKIVEGIVMAIPNLIISVGKMLGIVQGTKDQIDDHSTKMGESVNTSTTGISSDINSMIDNLNSKTNTAKSTLKSTSSYVSTAKDDMNKKADDLQKTAAEVQKSTIIAYENIEAIIAHARASLQSSYEKMEVDIQVLITKFEERGAINAQPKVDPTGVEKGCEAIINAVDKAIASLNRLSSASAGGGGGFGGGHASGGWVSAGTTYLVGELGPELITPTRSGYVHTAEETADMLGDSGQTINITIQGDVYDDEYSMKRKLKNAMLDVLQEQMAYA